MGVKLEQPLLSLVIEQFEFCGAVVKVSMNLMLFATAAPLWPELPNFDRKIIGPFSFRKRKILFTMPIEVYIA